MAARVAAIRVLGAVSKVVDGHATQADDAQKEPVGNTDI
jgi:hypothetical protein